MTAAVAIRAFFSVPSFPVSTPEIKALKDAISSDEYHNLGKACAEAMGQTFELVADKVGK